MATPTQIFEPPQGSNDYAFKQRIYTRHRRHHEDADCCARKERVSMGGLPSTCLPMGLRDDAGAILSDFNGLPVLPLDRRVPSYALKRRGAISGISEATSEVDVLIPTYRRRGAISYQPEDNRAMYIRHLGDAVSKGGRQKAISELTHLPELPQSDNLLPLAMPAVCERRGSFQLCGPPAQHYRHMLKGTAVNHLGVDGQLRSIQIQGLLQGVDNWEFDMFAFRRVSEGRPLFCVGLQLLQKNGMVDFFKLDILQVMKFLSIAEESYHSDNPYHNSTHAADVLQALHCLIMESALCEEMTAAEYLAAILAAICHDIDHPGVNQTFLINTSSYLASIHGKHSLLEHHHVHAAHAIIAEAGLLQHLEEEDRREILGIMDELIYATDISRHKEFVGLFEQRLSFGLNLSGKEDRQLALQITLKCADISNPCRPWRVCRVWSENIMEEFFRQGDCERSLNLPISFLCDRHTIQIPAAQRDFIQFVAYPFFALWHLFCKSGLSHNLMYYLCENQRIWEDIANRTTVRVSDDSADDASL